MLYYLFTYLHETFDIPGAGVFQYISFRAAMAVIVSLLISMIFGGKIIKILAKKQVYYKKKLLEKYSIFLITTQLFD